MFFLKVRNFGFFELKVTEILRCHWQVGETVAVTKTLQIRIFNEQRPWVFFLHVPHARTLHVNFHFWRNFFAAVRQTMTWNDHWSFHIVVGIRGSIFNPLFLILSQCQFSLDSRPPVVIRNHFFLIASWNQQYEFKFSDNFESPVAWTSRNFSGDINPFVSSTRTGLKLWNVALVLSFLISETCLKKEHLFTASGS